MDRWKLLKYLTHAKYKDVNTRVAKYFFENETKIKGKNQNWIVRHGHFSQASVSRFLNKFLGDIDAYQENTEAIQLYWNAQLKKDLEYTSLSSTISNTKSDLRKKMDDVFSLEDKVFLIIISLIKRAKRILFLGHPETLNVVLGLQNIWLNSTTVGESLRKDFK